jgi:hypothetical protein
MYDRKIFTSLLETQKYCKLMIKLPKHDNISSYYKKKSIGHTDLDVFIPIRPHQGGELAFPGHSTAVCHSVHCGGGCVTDSWPAGKPEKAGDIC